MLVQLAWRNIWRNRARSVVILFSVAFGLLAGIAVLALYKGMMNSRVRTVIDSETGHLQLHHPFYIRDRHPAFIIPSGDSLLAALRAWPGVKTVVPRTIVQGMLTNPKGSTGVQVIGVLPELEYAGSGLKAKLQSGELFHEGKKNEILLGRKLADKMKLKPGSKLVLTFSDTADNLVSAAFRVAGIYQSGNSALDEWNVYVLMSTLNEYLLTGPGFHEVALILEQDRDMEKRQQELGAAWPGLLIRSWKEISPETALMVSTVDDYSYIIMIIILTALAFGILNTMLMSVLERTREIGMMLALGISRVKIFLLVLTETFFLTLAGTPAGLLVAYGLTAYFQKHGIDLSGSGKEMLASFGFSTTVYPVFPSGKLAVLLCMVAGTALLSSLLPAWKALRLQPVQALRR